MLTGGAGRGVGCSPKGRDILREEFEIKYVFIEKYQTEFSIKAMYRILCVAVVAGIFGVCVVIGLIDASGFWKYLP